MVDRPTEDLEPPRRRHRFSDAPDLSKGGVFLPRYFPLVSLLTVFAGVAAGTSWSMGVTARVEAIEKTIDPENREGIVSRNQARINRLEETNIKTSKQTARLILVLCSLCKGLPRADCSEACKPEGN